MKIMSKPKFVHDETFGIYSGQQIIWRFYEQGMFKKNNIPYELEEKNWIPDEKTFYKVWWHSTNPADPSDPGDDILDYIEVCSSGYIENILEEVNEKLIEPRYFNVLLNLATKLNINIGDK